MNFEAAFSKKFSFFLVLSTFVFEGVLLLIMNNWTKFLESGDHVIDRTVPKVFDKLAQKNLLFKLQ